MDFNMEEVLNKVMEQMNSVAKTKTVIGDPFKLGEFTCVPVIKIGVGFGSGGGGSAEADEKGKKVGGAGAGIGMEPIGFLVSRGDEISMVSVARSKGLQSVFEKVPDLLESIIKNRKDKKQEEKEDENS